jgi:predicted nuclease with TOPRIM domain
MATDEKKFCTFCRLNRPLSSYSMGLKTCDKHHTEESKAKRAAYARMYRKKDREAKQKVPEQEQTKHDDVPSQEKSMKEIFQELTIENYKLKQEMEEMEISFSETIDELSVTKDELAVAKDELVKLKDELAVVKDESAKLQALVDHIRQLLL